MTCYFIIRGYKSCEQDWSNLLCLPFFRWLFYRTVSSRGISINRKNQAQIRWINQNMQHKSPTPLIIAPSLSSLKQHQTNILCDWHVVLCVLVIYHMHWVDTTVEISHKHTNLPLYFSYNISFKYYLQNAVKQYWQYNTNYRCNSV